MGRYNLLYPPFKELILKFEEDFKKTTGIPIYLFCGYRSFEEQDKLYQIGRQNIPNEKIVTNAQAGQSFHNFGIAADYVFDADLLKPEVQWSWRNQHPWNKIGQIASNNKLIWGGLFKFVDKPHLEKNWNLDLLNCNILYKLGGLSKVWEELDNRVYQKIIIPVEMNIKSTENVKNNQKNTQINTKSTIIQSFKKFFGIISK